MTPDWIAVDWGTSRLRAWAMGSSGILTEGGSERGMGSLAPNEFEPALLEVIGDWLDGPADVVACGMVGARQGWVEASYRTVPCTPLGPPLTRAPTTDPRLSVWIAPGLSQARPADVMRGEETQVAGFLKLNPNYDGVVCLPGTHTKWVHVSAGEVVSFATFMTGELFDLLSRQSVLRHGMEDGWDDDAFLEAVSEAMARPERLAGQLFGLRAAGLLRQLQGNSARARLSGLLIGAELAAAKPYWLGQSIALVGDEALARIYATGLRAQAVEPIQTDPKAMTLAGLIAARALIKESA